ncbi:hypothetical protein HanPI659440_Chr17g0665761 [Helianthus annuus]|nr:hypothetical protein HanPI659440_Chr17g0665761 [Helianthus annuus]
MVPHLKPSSRTHPNTHFPLLHRRVDIILKLYIALVASLYLILSLIHLSSCKIFHARCIVIMVMFHFTKV